jgi:glucosamine--fructose-6-phosphate aminotransferase (isomerizing)
MCGIIGYTGKNKALPVLLNGIKKLEYRGYDSAGLAILNTEISSVGLKKAVGKVENLVKKMGNEKLPGSLGIVHSRWATHGGVTEENAHPHTDCKGEIFLVHNGIIENYKELKIELEKKGHLFVSETDTEALVHLIESFYNSRKKVPLEIAVRKALARVRGTYGLAIFSSREPEKLIAVRFFSPLLVGVGRGENFIASDASAILVHTRHVIYLKDGEMAILTPKSVKVFDTKQKRVQRAAEKLDFDIEAIQKSGYKHFMLKEIYEQPEAIADSIRGRIHPKTGEVILGGLTNVMEKLKSAKRILIASCGTAYLAGRAGEYLLEEIANMPVKIDLASEFRYRKPVFLPGDVLLVTSQSGETADTLAALQEAKNHGVLTLGIVNVVGSTLARETDAGVYQHIGPEIAVASTKAFTSQVAILTLLSVLLGRMHGKLSPKNAKVITDELRKMPRLIEQVLKEDANIKRIVKKYLKFENFLYIGRKYNLPTALEGALKLKEISYVHAEGMSAGEMKHGSIALISKDFPSIVIVPKDSVYEKVVSNLSEIKARGGPVIAVISEGDKHIASVADDVIVIPKTLEALTPILATVVLQLFAYHFAVMRGRDVDKPRNLAKSVTVE